MKVRIAAFSAGVMLLGSCASPQQRAPVVDRSGGAPPPAVQPQTQPAAAPSAPRPPAAPAAIPAPSAPSAAAKPPADVVVARTTPAWDPNDPRPDFHTVQRGETLFGIALAYGLTYREVAEWNGMIEPYVIKVGQQLRLRPAQNNVTVIPARPTAVDSTTIITDQTQEAGTLGGDAAPPAQVPAPPAAPATPQSSVPAPAPAQGAAAPSTPPTAMPRSIPVKTEPKALKLPYTEANWARFEQVATPAGKSAAPIVEGPAADKATEKPVEVSTLPKTEPKAESAAAATAMAAPSVVVEGVEWTWPAVSKVTRDFSDVSKGIALAGSQGQNVLASAAGQVSYVGNSLRGYGKMIVIKHNKMFLSVYAHNSKVFVKEGQSVGKGQKIAEMGNTEAEGAVLHFEIRRYGKPVDPLKYLPNGASS